MTHWSMKSFPVELDQVCLPNSLKLAYYDQRTQSWPARRRARRPSFAHHCQLDIPETSPFSPLLKTKGCDVSGDGPTSYEVIASQTSCPQGLNAHEYMAFQSLLSGKRRRWITILLELGSSNMNLATESAVNLLSHLALQVGPSDPTNELLGMVHSVFRDPSYSSALLQQLDRKLDAISSNWRETYLMEIIITLLACVVTRTTPYNETVDISYQAVKTLLKARQHTLEWTRKLRQEMGNFSDPKSAKSCQDYMLSAALLCKRTFFVYLQLPGHYLDEDSLATLVECCITVHDNNPRTLQSVPIMLRNSIVRDLKMMHELQGNIREAMEDYGESSILMALYRHSFSSDSKYVGDLEFHEGSWLQLEASDEVESGDFESQIITYNYLHGALLIDGEPLGVRFLHPTPKQLLT